MTTQHPVLTPMRCNVCGLPLRWDEIPQRVDAGNVVTHPLCEHYWLGHTTGFWNSPCHDRCPLALAGARLPHWPISVDPYYSCLVCSCGSRLTPTDYPDHYAIHNWPGVGHEPPDLPVALLTKLAHVEFLTIEGRNGLVSRLAWATEAERSDLDGELVAGALEDIAQNMPQGPIICSNNTLVGPPLASITVTGRFSSTAPTIPIQCDPSVSPGTIILTQRPQGSGLVHVDLRGLERRAAAWESQQTQGDVTQDEEV